MRHAQPLDAANVRRLIGLALAGHCANGHASDQAGHHTDRYAGRHAGQLLHRLDGVLLVAEGRSCKEVGQWFGVDRRTVQRWVHKAMAQQGLPGLADAHHGGRPKALDAQQLQRVQQDVLGPPALQGYPEAHWSGKRLALHLQQHCGVTLSVRSCQRLMAAAAAAKPVAPAVD